jgi:transposase
MSRRRTHDAAFNARLALEAVNGERTVSDLAAEYGVNPTMIHQWKRSLLEGAAGIFERGGKAGPTSLSDRYTPIDAHPGDYLAQTARLQSLRRMTSCSISRSSVRSATIFFNRLFSSSSCFSRFISVGNSPAYRFFQLK